MNFNWLINLSVQTFQPLIVIYIMGNFVYHHWGLIYWPLSYPCRFLTFASFIQLVCVDVKIYFYPKIYNILVAAPLTSRGYVFLDWKNSLKPSQYWILKIEIALNHPRIYVKLTNNGELKRSSIYWNLKLQTKILTTL